MDTDHLRILREGPAASVRRLETPRNERGGIFFVRFVARCGLLAGTHRRPSIMTAALASAKLACRGRLAGTQARAELADARVRTVTRQAAYGTDSQRAIRSASELLLAD